MLRIGARGQRVVELQRSLIRLGYWLGQADGTFDELTRQAVYALQHVAGISPDGVVGPRTESALARGLRPLPRSVAGDALEVDVRRQLLLVVEDGRLAAVLHVSTGGGYLYAQRGGLYRATTPRGQFTVERRIDGWQHSELGWLWRPAYFSAGYALHGYPDVPPLPASHGCIRVSVAAMDWLWATGQAQLGQKLWVY